VNASDPAGLSPIYITDGSGNMRGIASSGGPVFFGNDTHTKGGGTHTATIGGVNVRGTSAQIKRIKALFRKAYENTDVPSSWSGSIGLVPDDVQDAYHGLLAWEKICRVPGVCGQALSDGVRAAAKGMLKAINKTLGSWKCTLLGWGCGEVPTAAAAFVPKKLTSGYTYRSGSQTDRNLTPRSDDTDGLSSNVNVNEFPRGTKLQKIDISKLPDSLEAVNDKPNGHVSIRTADPDDMEAWIGSKDADGVVENVTSWTVDLRNAIVGTLKVTGEE
jgi:hypothetical protein